MSEKPPEENSEKVPKFDKTDKEFNDFITPTEEDISNSETGTGPETKEEKNIRSMEWEVELTAQAQDAHRLLVDLGDSFTTDKDRQDVLDTLSRIIGNRDAPPEKRKDASELYVHLKWFFDRKLFNSDRHYLVLKETLSAWSKS